MKDSRPSHRDIHGGKHRLQYWAWYGLCRMLPTRTIAWLLGRMR